MADGACQVTREEVGLYAAASADMRDDNMRDDSMRQKSNTLRRYIPTWKFLNTVVHSIFNVRAAL
jgi:hypothetical protein